MKKIPELPENLVFLWNFTIRWIEIHPIIVIWYCNDRSRWVWRWSSWKTNFQQFLSSNFWRIFEQIVACSVLSFTWVLCINPLHMIYLTIALSSFCLSCLMLCSKCLDHFSFCNDVFVPMLWIVSPIFHMCLPIWMLETAAEPSLKELKLVYFMTWCSDDKDML